MQLWCWAGWAVGIQGGTSAGPAGLECSCGVGPGGLSVYKAALVPGQLDCSAVVVLSRVGCRYTG